MKYLTKLTISTVALIIVGTTPRTAAAGDACPVYLPIVDLGLPGWASQALKDHVKGGDAFLGALVKAGDWEDQCRTTKLLEAKNESFPVELYEPPAKSELKLSAIKARLVDNKKRFRCKAAAKKLEDLSAVTASSGSIVYYRGHKRILLVIPGWNSMCISAKKADSLKPKQVRALYKKLTRKIVDYRIANP